VRIVVRTKCLVKKEDVGANTNSVLALQAERKSCFFTPLKTLVSGDRKPMFRMMDVTEHPYTVT
jgi:hypothetical protein